MMPFKPFSNIAKKIDETIGEYALGVGMITLFWAHLELAFDLLIRMDHTLTSGEKYKHPVPFTAKVDWLEKALIEGHAHFQNHRDEMIHVISLGKTAASRRNLVVHGALMSTLSETEASLTRVLRAKGESDIESGKISLAEMDAIFKMIFEATAHTYNIIINLLRQELGDDTPEPFKSIKNIDVSKFRWQAINSSKA